MDLTLPIDWLGDRGAEALGGLMVGLLFGACAQRSAFCLRAATVEFWRGSLGAKTTRWLLVFGTALLGTQVLFETGQLHAGTIRQLTSTGTLSGAILGGLMFGAGMILARGCASRLLVLSATGNLRALVAGLVLTIVAQASLRGILAPLRADLSSLWLIDADTRNLMNVLPAHTGLVAGFLTVALALCLSRHHRLSPCSVMTGLGVGAAVVLGWAYTASLAAQSFDVVAVQSVTFTGPSTDTLMALINQPELPFGFGLGLVPGVFLGSLAAAIASGGFRIQSFDATTPLPRYLAGASLMGFGSMLAGGCAVGAGVTGGAVMALTAWIALTAMWVGAGVTDLVIDRPRIATGRQPASIAGR